MKKEVTKATMSRREVGVQTERQVSVITVDKGSLEEVNGEVVMRRSMEINSY